MQQAGHQVIMQINSGTLFNNSGYILPEHLSLWTFPENLEHGPTIHITAPKGVRDLRKDKVKLGGDHVPSGEDFVASLLNSDGDRWLLGEVGKLLSLDRSKAQT